MKSFFISISICLSMLLFAGEKADQTLKTKNSGESIMQRFSTKKGEIKLVGIKVRTSFLEESKLETSKIFPCVKKYYHQKLFEKILSRNKPGTTYCVYTEYESDYTGAYTYFIGEEVSSFDNLPSGLEPLIIPFQKYTVFTTQPGSMPDVVKDAWKKIWNLSSETLGGIRRYHTDFEIYDERASESDLNNVVLDIYIGIK